MNETIRVLYAEDNAADADLTKEHFSLHAPDIELDVVNSGEKCLTQLRDGSYDALLLDNHLPDMDGIEILKAAGGTGALLPVVIVTGVGDEALVVQVLRLGAWDYVPKHGNYLQTLPAVLKQSVSEFRERLRKGCAERERARRILYVERDAADVDLTLRHFAEAAAQFSITIASSGGEALARLQEGQFDLVLADLRMPDMNALDLLGEIKRGGAPVPFIVITGRGDESAAVAALKLGAADYIVKRDNYLTQLPYAIENAIARAELAETNRRLERELAERQRAEAEEARLLVEVQGQHQRMAEIIDSLQGLVWESRGGPDDSEQRVEFISGYAERMLGYSVHEWLTTPGFWLRIVHPDDRARVRREAAGYFASRKGGISQFRSIAADGRIVWMEARSTIICDDKGNAVGMRGVVVDISADKEAEQVKAELEEQLQQAHKMESIGRLAGGIAHDFNNILTIINGYADLMMQQAPAGDPFRTPLTEIRAAGGRAAELTHQLLAFSRRQLLQPQVLDLNCLIPDSITLLKRLLGEDIELITRLDPELGRVKADKSQMNQVILNVAINARDVMPRGGRLTLETRNVDLDQSFAQKRPEVKPGPYVMLAISDTGCGMDAQTLARMFEPFFTTKEQGKGTGLGLSTVYGIVKQSGGSIWVYSEVGRGTTFKIYLPRVDEPVIERGEPIEPETESGTETILIVEDDQPVRKLICQTLQGIGYKVIEAANGDAAVAACEAHRDPIPLMITDVVMPQMSGRELADRLIQLHPQMLVLYISGYTDDAAIRHGLLKSSAAFLEKPFSPSALARKVRSMLDRQVESHAS